MPTSRSPSPVQGNRAADGYEAWPLHREAVAAADSLPETNKARGMNMQGYDTAIVDVIPADGANPTVDVLFWSERAGQFVREHTNLQFAGVGVDTPFQFRVEARGRIMFVAVTTIAAGTVSIGVAGARTMVEPPA